jgi:hypothetical protein
LTLKKEVAYTYKTSQYCPHLHNAKTQQ